MIKIKLSAIILTVVMSMLAFGCSSEKEPIAEVFLGEWNIYEKTDNSGTAAAEGIMNIDFGNEVINFSFTLADESLSLNGIVYNDRLYDTSKREVLFGKLEKDQNILSITLEETGVKYKAR